MRWFLTGVAVSAALVLPLDAAPKITRVANAAGFGRYGTPSWPVAPGSLVTLTGQGLGPEEAVKAQGFPLANELGGVAVQIVAGTQTLDAWVVAAASNSVTFLLPSRTRTGDALVRLRYQGEAGLAQMGIVPRNFGIFSANGRGTGPADVSLSLSTAARPGQTITLRGTGLGAIDGDDAAAPRPGDLRTGIHVLVGTREANVTYAGRAECCPGVDEVRFEVPDGVEGCYVPVATLLDDALDARTYRQRQSVSNTVTLAVSSDGGPCRDLTGLNGEDLKKLEQNGMAKAGVILLGHTFDSSVDLRRNPAGADRALASFAQAGTAQLLASAGILGLPSPGACISNPYDDNVPALALPGGTPLDAGTELRIESPGGTLIAARNSDGAYAAAAAPKYFTAGTYEVSNGDGGAGVGPFRATLTAPAPVIWTNKDTAYPRGRNSALKFEWQGGRTGEYVVVFTMAENNAAKIYTVCTERAEVGVFTTPAHGPFSLPIDSNEFGGLPGLIGFGSVFTTRFDAPGLDAGLLGVSFLDAIFSP